MIGNQQIDRSLDTNQIGFDKVCNQTMSSLIKFVAKQYQVVLLPNGCQGQGMIDTRSDQEVGQVKMLTDRCQSKVGQLFVSAERLRKNQEKVKKQFNRL